jgi:NADH-quinone oxidoreductase subunit N
MIGISTHDLQTVAPLLTIILTGMIVLMVDLALPRDRKTPLLVLSFLGIIIAAGCCVNLWSVGQTAFAGTVIADDFAILFQFILLVVVALSIALSARYIQTKDINYGEYYALLLFATSGAMLMATSRELITIFVGLEVLSIALYILSGFARTEARSEESAMKYFLLGAFSSGFFLYGIALIYGGTDITIGDVHYVGTTMLGEIAQRPAAALSSPYTIAGIALLIVGLGFKSALVPFHSWTPDVYEGAPTSVTAFMSAGAKAGAFAAFIRIAVALLPVAASFHGVLWGLAVLTMVVGNVIAVVQVNIKRMLAYSSIAHAGYILVGLLAKNVEGQAGVLFYVLAYTFMNLGAFGVLILLARRGSELNRIDDLRGLGAREPAVAALMTIFLLSLAGIPPTAGFFGKFYLFIAAIHTGQYVLAVIGLLASVVGAFYYLWVISAMWFRPAEREFPTRVWSFAPGAAVALIISAIFSLLLGVQSTGAYDVSLQAAESLKQPIPVEPAASQPAAATQPGAPQPAASAQPEVTQISLR